MGGGMVDVHVVWFRPLRALRPLREVLLLDRTGRKRVPQCKA